MDPKSFGSFASVQQFFLEYFQTRDCIIFEKKPVIEVNFVNDGQLAIFDFMSNSQLSLFLNFIILLNTFGFRTLTDFFAACQNSRL